MKKTYLLDAVSAYSFIFVSHFASCAAIATGLLFGIAPQLVQGAPIQLNATDFDNQIAGLSIQVEGFEGFTLGAQTSPLTLVNATYTSDIPWIASDFILPTKVLINNDQDITERIFNGFAPGTTMFGLDIDGFLPNDLLLITAVGTSGVFSVQQTIGSLNGFVGFKDTLGLISVSFFNFGTPPDFSEGGNYAFDNVTTGIVPIPAAVWLFGSGLLGLIGIARRKRAA